MSIDMALFLVTSGSYRLAFVSEQISTMVACPSFDMDSVVEPGLLGSYEGMQVIHPGWLWGQEVAPQAPRFLLVLRTGSHALAVDTCRREQLQVQAAPAVCAGNGMIYGLISTPDGLAPVLDLSSMPLA